MASREGEDQDTPPVTPSGKQQPWKGPQGVSIACLCCWSPGGGGKQGSVPEHGSPRHLFILCDTGQAPIGPFQTPQSRVARGTDSAASGCVHRVLYSPRIDTC